MPSQAGTFTAAGQDSGWVTPTGSFYVQRDSGGVGTVVLDVRGYGDADAGVQDETSLVAGTFYRIAADGSGRFQYRLRCSFWSSGSIGWRIVL